MDSIGLTPDELQKLKESIASYRLKVVKNKSEYEHLRIQDEGLIIIIYNSGKVVFNERAKHIMESILIHENYDYILGSDEVGKGEWFGPLIVVATALTPQEIINLRKIGVKDSKKLKKAQIIKLGNKLINMDFIYSSRTLPPKTYNKLYDEFKKEGKNLNDLLAWAHSAVIKETLAVINYKKAKVVIDQFDYSKTNLRLLNIDKSNIEIVQKTGAESETSVAAASIIAKYLFEREVDKLNNKYDLELRKSIPTEVNAKILPYVAKMHFRNVNYNN